MSDETKPPGDADARERDLDAASAELAKIYAGTSGPGSLDYMRAGYDAATVRAQEQIAKSEADADEQYAQSIRLGDDLRREKARAEQLERELKQFQKTSFAMREALEDRVAALERELAAERERIREILRACDGRDPIAHFERLWRRAESALAAERAELKRCRKAVRRALVYLTDKDDVESTPHHAIGHAVHESKDLSAAPPVEAQDHVADITRKLDQAQRENATLGADNERLCKELLEADNARRDGRQLLRRFVKYAREDKAVTPGCTRLERLTEQVADYLRRTNNPSDILRGDEP